VRVVFSTTALVSFMSGWKAAAPTMTELGIGAFAVVGVTYAASGPLAPFCVAAACVLGAFARAVDIESWALFVPGGLVGRGEAAFGSWGGSIAAAAVLVERLLLCALAPALVGQYAARVGVALVGTNPLPTGLAIEDIAAGAAVIVLGVLWIRARLGRGFRRELLASSVWIGAGILTTIAAGGAISALVASAQSEPSVPFPAASASTFQSIRLGLLGLAVALPVLGGGGALASAAHEFPQPRVRALRRTSHLLVLFAFVAIVTPAFAFSVLLPGAEGTRWPDTPLVGLAMTLASPWWVHDLAALAVAGAAAFVLVPALQHGLGDAEQMLRRMALQQALPEALTSIHPRFGTPARAIDVAAGATILVMLAGGSRVMWLAHAYAAAVGLRSLFKLSAHVRLRTTRPGPRPFKAPFNLRVGGREIPVGLLAAALLVASALAVMFTGGDIASVTAAALVGSLTLLFSPARRRTDRDPAEGSDVLEVLPSSEVSLGQVEARRGNLLVPVRNPHALTHLTAALQTPRDRDVVVMTVRLLGNDGDEGSGDASPTHAERALLSRVVAVAERHSRPVRLLIVPATDIFDAITATVIRLGSSEVYAGESSTLTADDQARRLGDSWERAERPAGATFRLVIHHGSGRADIYQIGAHLPALTPGDLDLIHRLWLDAVKAVGPHVHHHDVVRAALTQMEQQLSGTGRDDALAAIRNIARPADELAAVIRARDFPRLRDMVRNRDAADLATLLTDMSVEDEVVFFRVLPRKDAAAVFEYLSPEAQETLLKAMAQEDVAALLSNMAPDDRTMFLEELPATATRQLLALLSPSERAVALTLLGYPEGSTGRLMTPNYVAVREGWTVREVLDYIREHGQDSETLNVIYVIDDHGRLVDDIRIRELLLTPLDKHVDDLMDRRFVALTATDDQQTAVAAFRKYDRTALPVTDTAGMLIGIVTIDDVLDVAEATATKEIQRIGGSEALDEPYMQIGMGRMIQKRAGWLTALFLGEMLTATAMGVFEAEIARAVVLALFVPLIISSGGNSGSQASTLVIRALALGEVGLGDWWRVMRREVLAGICLGAILGIIGFLRITIWSAFSDIYGPHWLLVGLTVGTALIGIVLWGTLIGSLLPFLLRRLGFDPATSSAPFVATLVDVTGLLIYFTVALVMLRGTLL
jgi:magnesium transporter